MPPPVQVMSDPFTADLSASSKNVWSAAIPNYAPSQTDLSLVVRDSILVRKMDADVAARRARFARVVKVIFSGGLLLCAVAGFRVAFGTGPQDEVAAGMESTAQAAGTGEATSSLPPDESRSPRSFDTRRRVVPTRGAIHASIVVARATPTMRFPR